jgi:hypothetical protein
VDVHGKVLKRVLKIVCKGGLYWSGAGYRPEAADRKIISLRVFMAGEEFD